MKFPKSNLDEMQKKNVAKIESIGLRIAIALLMLSTFVQIIMNAEPKQIAVEFWTGEILCIYQIISLQKIGVWDRYGRASMKNYFLGSIAAAIIVGSSVCLMSTLYGAMYSVVADGLIYAGLTFATAFPLTILLKKLHKKRREKLDSGEAYQGLAAKIGVTVQTLKAIEDGSFNPSIKLCRAICRATGKTLDELFWKENE